MLEEKIQQTDPGRRYRRVLSASTLAGDHVRNSAGEDLGKVHEVMIDVPTGRWLMRSCRLAVCSASAVGFSRFRGKP